MKNIGYLLLATLILVSCDKEAIRVSGNVITIDYAIDDIRTLELSHAFDSDIYYDPTARGLNIDINENLQDHLQVSISGTTLKVGLSDNLRIKGNATLKVRLTTNNLTNISLSGASTASMKSDVVQDAMNLELSGASEFDGNLDLNNLDAELSGASEMDIIGSIDKADLSCSGGSQVGGFAMLMNDLKITCSGASSGEFSVSDKLDVSLSGASELTYDGDPDIVREELSGASTLRKKD